MNYWRKQLETKICKSNWKNVYFIMIKSKKKKKKLRDIFV